MDAESQIAAAVAAIREHDGPSLHRMAARPTRPSYQPPIGNKAGQAKRFSAPPSGGAPVSNPWPSRAGIAGKIRRAVNAAAEIATRRPVELAAFSLLVAGMVRVAVHLAEPDHPVIVKLFWQL